MINTKISFIKLTAIVFVLTGLFSCSSSSEPSCKVVNFNTAVLFYDELTFTPLTANLNFDNRIDLVYENDRISQSTGGLKNLIVGGQPFLFNDNDISKTVTYNGNTVTLNSTNLYSKEFVIQNNRLVSQKTTYSPYLYISYLMNQCSELLTYDYSGDEISESYNGLLRRKFYIVDGNLDRVELFKRSNGEIIKKIEYFFSGYNSEPNLLRGKYFIDGNFFSAFSNNNYTRIDIKFYDFVSGDYEYKPMEDAYFGYGILPSDLFTQDCQ